MQITPIENRHSSQRSSLAKKLTLSAAGLALSMAAFSSSVSAADLRYDEYRDGRYKDRSYIDKTLDEYERRTAKYKHNHYDGKPRGKHWRDNGYGHYACLHPRQIRRRLVKRGWHDFQILRERPRRIVMLATNYNGRRFRIVVDKCDADIVRRRPIRRYWGWGR